MKTSVETDSSCGTTEQLTTVESQLLTMTYSNKLEKIIDFLAKKPDVDIFSIKDARLYSLLHIACLSSQINTCNAFFNHIKNQNLPGESVKAWVNAKTNEGFTALHFASFKGNIELVKLLEFHGADIHVKNDKNLSVVHIAAQGDQPVSIAYFQSQGLSINEVDSKGSTPLHWACFLGMENAVTFLTTWGSDINIQDTESGLTPLHLAVISGNPRVVRRLLIKHADKTIRSFEDKLPIDLAIENDYDNIVKILQNKNWILSCLNIKPNLEKTQSRFSLYLFFSIFVSAALVNIFLVGPFIEQFWWTFLFCLFTSLMLVFFLLSWLSNPGKIQKQSQGAILNLLLNHNPHSVCPECVIVKPIRSRHCDFCNACISVYDHHCPWINNCVGSKNHAYFIVFIILSLLNTILLGVIALFTFEWTLKWSESNEKPIYKYAPKIFEDSDAYILKQVTCIADLLTCVFFLIPLAALNYIQLGNFSIGKTTNERFGFNVRRDHNSQTFNHSFSSDMEMLSPYKEQSKFQCFSNFYSMCCKNKSDVRYNFHITQSPKKERSRFMSEDSQDYSAI